MYPSVPRPIPQRSASITSHTRSRSAHPPSSPNNNSTTSLTPSETDSNSSPSSTSNSPRSTASKLPPTRSILGKQSPTKRISGLPLLRDKPDRIVDYGENPQSAQSAQLLDVLVSPLSNVVPPLAGLSMSPTSNLSTASSKRNFAATPSFPSPLARASIVPRSEDSDEDDPNADVEVASLEGVVQPGSSFGADGSRRIRPRRPSSSLFRQGPRAASPSTMLHLMTTARQASSVTPSPSNSEGSSGNSLTVAAAAAGDMNVLGLTTREREGRRTESSGLKHPESSEERSSPTRSPTRTRRRSELLIADYPDRAAIMKNPIAIPRAIPAASLSIPITANAVSPLNALPPPWGHSPTSSLSSSPTDSNFSGAIRLQRVPTSVRLASDLMGSSPHSLSPSNVGIKPGNGSMPKSDTSSVGFPPSSIGLSSGSDSSLSFNLGIRQRTSTTPNPSLNLSPNTSPKAHLSSLPAPAVTPLSTPAVEYRNPLESSFGRPAFSVSLGANYGQGSLGHGGHSRPSLPAPSAYDPLFLPLPLSSKASAFQHHRYRTSVHETSLSSSSIGQTAQAQIKYGDAPGESGKVGHNPADVARTIMNSRSAKVSRWKRNSQTSLVSLTPEVRSPPLTTPLSWGSPSAPLTSTGERENEMSFPLGEPLSRSYTVPRRLNERDVTDGLQLGTLSSSAKNVDLGKEVLERPGIISNPSSKNYVEWVDWLDEYKQFKEAKIRAELQGFTMLTGARRSSAKDDGSSAVGHPNWEVSLESSSDIGDARPDKTLVLNSSGVDSTSTPSSPLANERAGDKKIPPVPRRSSSAITLGVSSGGSQNLTRVPSANRLVNIFERPRNFSSSTTDSRESVEINKPRRHVGNKIEGWWKSVKNTLTLTDHPHVKTHKPVPVVKPAGGFVQPSTTSLQSVSPAPIRFESSVSNNVPFDPPLSAVPALTSSSNPSPSAIIGFFPSTSHPSGLPLQHRRSAQNSLRSLPSRDALAPAVSLVSSLRPSKPTDAQARSDRLPPFLRALSGSKSDKTTERSTHPAEMSLEARRRQPPLSLKLDKPQLRSHSSSAHGSVSSTDRPFPHPLHPRQQASRTSSSGTDPDSSSFIKAPLWAQTPSPLYAILPDDQRITPDFVSPGMGSQFNSAAIQREIRHRLTTQKEVCNKELNKVIHLITLFVEAKLNEVNEAEMQAEMDMDIGYSYSAMDSQSDFGGDESDRAEFRPSARRVSRPSSRRPSVSMACSPVKRRESLRPNDVSNFPVPRRRSRTQDQRSAQPATSALKSTSSNPSSRSTSRSRSPYPAQLAADSPTLDDNTGLSSPFLATLQEIIDIATEILDMSISAMTARPGTCPAYVQKVQHVGTAWDQHPDWPGRGWYVQLLLAVAGLSRVVEWWEAEKGFWNFADNDKEEEPLTFVIKPVAKVGSPGIVSPIRTDLAVSNAHGLGFGSKFEAHSQFSSIGHRLTKPNPSPDETTFLKVDSGPPREDLKLQVEQAKTVNLVLELSLDGDIVEWINPAWQEVVGSDPGDVIGRPIHEYLAPADVSVFSDASRELLKDDSHTVEARFRLQVLPEASDEESEDREPGPVFIEMDGSGMLMRDRFSGEASHSMWVIKPVVVPEDAVTDQINSPLLPLTPATGVGFFRRLSTQPVSPFPHGRSISMVNVLCRICERQVPAWFFEKHNETCHEVHRLEADIGERNERISEFLQQATSLIATLDKSQPSSPLAYRGTPVSYFPSLTWTSNQPQRSSSPSQSPHSSFLDLQRSVVHRIVEILQVCLDVSIPSIKEDATEVPIEEQRLLSPRSEDYISTMNSWTQPASEDPALCMLIEDTFSIVRSKLNAVNRLRNTIVYSERVRREWEDKVEKALCALSECSDSDSSEAVSDSDAKVGTTPPLFSSPLQISNASSMSEEVTPVQQVDLTSSPSLPANRGLPSFTPIPKVPPQNATLAIPPSHVLLPSPSHDLHLSTSPLSPLSHGVERSPTRARKLSMSHKGRLSVGSDAPLSPRLPSTTPASRSTAVSIKDFEIIKPISKGAFGAVYLAKKTTTGDYFAIKMLKKADMISKNQITNVKAERKILMNQAESPYVVRLFFTFQNKHYLYLVMEYLPGGDLGGLVKKLGTLGEDWTRHFIAEIILGLESLHEKGVVHRDVKPDNLLIDARGHLKLTDFGLSRIGLLGRQAGGSRFTIPPKAPSRGRMSSRSSWSRNYSGDSSASPRLSPKIPTSVGASTLSQSYFGQALDADNRDDSSGSESMAGIPSGLRAPITPEASFAMGSKPFSPDGTQPPISETHKFVGTVDYVAPESILGLGGDDASVDWWALGVMMYELLYGCPPFNDETPERVFDNIISRRIVWPDPEDDEASPEARDLMERLMCTDPAQRLGAHGADAIKRHPFFEDINWDTISSEEGCFVPQVNEEISTDYFDARGLVELPEELDLINATVDSTALNPDSDRNADDFGTFNFRNLWASKAANDQVVQDMKAQAEADALLPPSIESSQSAARYERKKSVASSKKRSKAALFGNEQTKLPLPINPTTLSPVNTPSLVTSIPSSGPLSLVQHLDCYPRRPSDLERVQADSDISRGSSLPSRLRASSTSQGSNDTTSSNFSPPSSIPSPQSTNMIETAGRGRVQVLLAEDNPVSLKIACTILTKLGIECATVSNGSDALAVATTCAFDVMFLDVRLPHLDGDGVARYLKSVVGPNSETPIVAVTAVTEDDARTLSEHGTLFSAVVSKPLTKENVLAVLLKLGFKVENSAS